MPLLTYLTKIVYKSFGVKSINKINSEKNAVDEASFLNKVNRIPAMKRKYNKKPESQLRIAKERVGELFNQASLAFKENPELSNRYVGLARKIAMKFKVNIPSELKKRFCKHCYCYLMPGKNCRVRTHEGKVVYYCSGCRKYMRFPYKKQP
jgi:ribonuclease P protein subunit RPR2